MKEYFEFDHGQEIVLKFEQLLRQYGVEVPAGSDFEKKTYNVFEVLNFYENPKLTPKEEDVIPICRDFMSIYELAKKLVSVSGHSDFPKLVPHLGILMKCRIGQNSKSPITDQEANKIIELYIASLCMKLGATIALDHPQNSKGDNPDILSKIEKENWGFACKTLHTLNIQTIYENIVKAVDQIEKSPATIGIPVLNMKNVINHDLVWPTGESFPDTSEPLDQLSAPSNQAYRGLLQDFGPNGFQNIFEGKKSVPAFITISHSVTSIAPNPLYTPVATRLNLMMCFQSTVKDTPEFAMDVLRRINMEMQTA